MKRPTALAAGAALAATLLSCSASTTGGGGGPGPEGPTAGSGVPDFTVDDVDGREFHMADHVGREVILLNFWATWCEPCRVEMPHLDRIQQEYRDRGLRIYAVSMDGPESVSEVRSRIARYGYSFAVLLDVESEATRLYNPRTEAPFNVLVDRSGTIVWTHAGYSPGDEVELEEQVRAALE